MPPTPQPVLQAGETSMVNMDMVCHFCVTTHQWSPSSYQQPRPHPHTPLTHLYQWVRDSKVVIKEHVKGDISVWWPRFFRSLEDRVSHWPHWLNLKWIKAGKRDRGGTPLPGWKWGKTWICLNCLQLWLKSTLQVLHALHTLIFQEKKILEVKWPKIFVVESSGIHVLLWIHWLKEVKMA